MSHPHGDALVSMCYGFTATIIAQAGEWSFVGTIALAFVGGGVGYLGRLSFEWAIGKWKQQRKTKTEKNEA